MADTWYVKHIDENGREDIFQPNNINFTLRHKDCGDVSYDVPLSVPNMRWAFAGPKRTLYEVWNDSYSDPITAGHVSYINTKKGEEVLHVQGKTFLWWMQNRHYPFDPQDANAFLAGTAQLNQGLAYQRRARVDQICDDLFTKMMQTGYPPTGLESFQLQHAAIPITTDYRVELADTRSFFDMFTELSEVEPGFTFYDTPERIVYLIEGELFSDFARTDPSFCVYTFDENTPPTQLLDIEFENNGPEMTHILGIGAGSSTKLMTEFGYINSLEQFGRWDGVKQFPNTFNRTDLVSRTQKAFSKGLYPLHGIPLRVNANFIDSFWNVFSPGLAIWITENFESNHLQGASMIQEMEAHVNNQGDAYCDFTLEEINISGRPGIHTHS